MSRKNFERVWQVLLGRKPFRPITLELTSGGRLEVHHPEALRQEPGTDLFVYRGTTGISQVFECWAVVRFIDGTATFRRRRRLRILWSATMMIQAEFQDTLQQLLQRKPFRPFVIERDDGAQWIVSRPEDLMYYGGGATAIYFQKDGSFDFVDCEAVKQFLDLTTQPVS